MDTPDAVTVDGGRVLVTGGPCETMVDTIGAGGGEGGGVLVGGADETGGGGLSLSLSLSSSPPPLSLLLELSCAEPTLGFVPVRNTPQEPWPPPRYY